MPRARAHTSPKHVGSVRILGGWGFHAPCSHTRNIIFLSFPSSRGKSFGRAQRPLWVQASTETCTTCSPFFVAEALLAASRSSFSELSGNTNLISNALRGLIIYKQLKCILVVGSCSSIPEATRTRSATRPNSAAESCTFRLHYSLACLAP